MQLVLKSCKKKKWCSERALIAVTRNDCMYKNNQCRNKKAGHVNNFLHMTCNFAYT